MTGNMWYFCKTSVARAPVARTALSGLLNRGPHCTSLERPLSLVQVSHLVDKGNHLLGRGDSYLQCTTLVST